MVIGHLSFVIRHLSFSRGGFRDIRVKTFPLAVKPAPTTPPSSPECHQFAESFVTMGDSRFYQYWAKEVSC
ncbi:hypothetical protein [Coleofasciculus sp. F4-SAH-05]|uniref:hypothetical protein n=1 Tax=Coleofasciculus sp. F4-SAH-05 TaxID=3069525 RepID=UPI0032F98BCD